MRVRASSSFRSWRTWRWSRRVRGFDDAVESLSWWVRRVGDRCLWCGVYGGRTPTSLGAVGSCLSDLPRLRRTRLPRGVAVGKTDEALNGGPPIVELVGRRRVVLEQLSSC